MFGPIVVKAGSGIGAKTGAWRTTMRPKFKQKDCINCHMCEMVCPEGCIIGEAKNKYEADYDYCKGCGVCAMVCPKKDIEMVNEDKT